MATESVNRVRELRDGRDWTQRQLADRAGVTTTTISNLEAGGRPTIATAFAVASAFGLAIEDVFLPGASTANGEDQDAPDASGGAAGTVGASAATGAGTSPGDATSGDAGLAKLSDEEPAGAR